MRCEKALKSGTGSRFDKLSGKYYNGYMKILEAAIGEHMKSRKWDLMILIVVILAAGLLVWGSLFEFSYRVNGKLQKHAYQTLENAAADQNEAVNMRIDGKFTLLNTMADFLGDKAGITLEEVKQVLASTVSKGSFIRISVSDVNGKSYSTDNHEIDVKSREYFQNAMKGENYISDQLVSQVDGEKCIILSVPIYDAVNRKQINGVLNGVLRVDSIHLQLFGKEMGNHDYVILTDGKGNVISSANSKGRFDQDNILADMKQYHEKQASILEKQMKLGKSGNFAFDLNGKTQYINYTPLGIHDWFIFTVIPESAVRTQFHFISDQVYFLTIKLLAVFLFLFVVVTFMDRRQTKRLKEEKERLRLSDERYRILSEKSRDILFEADCQKGTIAIGDNYTEVFDDLKGKPIHTLTGKDYILESDWIKLQQVYEEMLENGRDIHMDFQILSKEHHYIWIRIIASVLYDEHGRPNRVIGKLTNIDEEKKKNNELVKKAELDSLTGIYNRRTVEFFIDQFLAEEGADGCHTMLILDVDDFKNINDTLGHLVGDQALIDLVANIRNNIRRSDILGRIGGDEFVVFLKDTVDDEQIAVISEKISQAVLCSQDIPFTVSVGAAHYPCDGIAFKELYGYADTQMYHEKRRNRR